MTTPHTPTTDAPGLTAVHRYVAFWNAGSADEQRHVADQTFSTDVSYHAPIAVLHGSEELIGFRTQFAQHSPDYVFRPRTEPSAHHDRARLQWELVVTGKTFATGTDVLELDDHGRIQSITAFLDQAPEGFAAHHD